MKFFYVLLIMITIVLNILGNNGTILSEIINPKKIIVGEKNIFISEKTSILIYSKENLKFKKKIGSKGEGPKEFVINSMSGFANIRLNVSNNEIVVTSLNKVTFYSIDGVYTKSIKTNPDFFEVKPLQNKYFVWVDSVDKERKRFIILNTVNKELKNINEFIRVPQNLDAIKGLFFYKKYIGFESYNDKIFVCHSKNLEIDVFDSKGKKQYVIKYPITKVDFDKKDEKAKREQFKIEQPNVYNYFSKKIFFPKKFPAVRRFIVSNNKLYVFTFTKKNEKSLSLIFDLKGNFIKKVFLPLKEMSLKKWFPFDIKDNKIFQLVENRDTEEWKMVFTEIK